MNHSLYEGKKVGIWGFGKTGQSALAFLAPHAEKISVFEQSPLSATQLELLQKHNALLVPTECLEQFLEINDIIIPSPGVDLRPYARWSEKWVSELTLFAQHVTTKTIAITGSVGKTSTVTLLTELLNRCGVRALAGGNIGTPLLELLPVQNQYDVLVLELSSFQLELPHTFSPSFAAITNLYPNHLDRHGDMETYARAKGQLFINQTDDCWAVIPFAFLETFIAYTAHQKVLWLADDAYLEYLSPAMRDITFQENWQLIFALLDQFGLAPETVQSDCVGVTVPEHRFEKVGTFDGITFYNDSKATIPPSTLESITRIGAKPIILFLGGLDKGVDRQPALAQLPANVVHILCFGKQADVLHDICTQSGLTSTTHNTLEDAWKQCTNVMQSGDTVLFSPAGASFDLFKDYQERGNVFKNLVHSFYQK